MDLEGYVLPIEPPRAACLIQDLGEWGVASAFVWHDLQDLGEWGVASAFVWHDLQDLGEWGVAPAFVLRTCRILENGVLPQLLC